MIVSLLWNKYSSFNDTVHCDEAGLCGASAVQLAALCRCKSGWRHWEPSPLTLMVLEHLLSAVSSYFIIGHVICSAVVGVVFWLYVKIDHLTVKTFLGLFLWRVSVGATFFLPSPVNPKQTWLLLGMEKISYICFVFCLKWKGNVASAALKRGKGLIKSEKLSSSKVLN